MSSALPEGFAEAAQEQRGGNGLRVYERHMYAESQSGIPEGRFSMGVNRETGEIAIRTDKKGRCSIGSSRAFSATREIRVLGLEPGDRLEPSRTHEDWLIFRKVEQE